MPDPVWCSAAREINPTVFHALACDQLYKFYISSPELISARVSELGSDSSTQMVAGECNS